MAEHEPLDLEEATSHATKPEELPRMPEPLPVWVAAVEDVILTGQSGLEVEHDELYVKVLLMEKEEPPEHGWWMYRADNVRVRFQIREGLLVRDSYRPLQVEVPSLKEVEARLFESEIEYAKERGIAPGSKMILILDVSGNRVEVTERIELL